MEIDPIHRSPPSADPASFSPRKFFHWQRAAFIIGLFLLSRGVLAVTAQHAWNHAGVRPPPVGDSPPAPDSITETVRMADADWYAELISRGYYFVEDPTTGKAKGNVVFYPVYPLLVRLVHILVPDIYLAGEIVSNALLVAACFLLWELAMLEFGSARAAAWTVAFAMCCPGAAWFSMVFSESTFFFILVAVMWSCRRRHWLLVAGTAFLLALTRAIGIVVVVFIACEVWSHWRERRSKAVAPPATTVAEYTVWALAIAAPVVGYLAFYVFLYFRFGDWHTQHKVILVTWPANAHLSTPWAAIMREWAPMRVKPRLIVYGLLLGNLVLVALTYPALRRWSYPAFASAMITMYVIAAYHSPMARYVGVLVPAHLTLGWLAVHLRGMGWVLLTASVSLMIVIVSVMVNGYVFY